MKKRSWIIVLILACLLLAGGLYMFLNQNKEKEFWDAGGQYRYRIRDAYTAVLVSSRHQEAEMHIPEDLDNYTVSEIAAEAFYGHQSVALLTFPDGLEVIGERAFSHCPKLEEVTLPEGLRRLEAEAFSHNPSLQRVIMRPGVVSLGKQLFEGCTNLHSLTFLGTQEEWDSIEKGANWQKDLPDDFRIIFEP